MWHRVRIGAEWVRAYSAYSRRAFLRSARMLEASTALSLLTRQVALPLSASTSSETMRASLLNKVCDEKRYLPPTMSHVTVPTLASCRMRSDTAGRAASDSSIVVFASFIPERRSTRPCARGGAGLGPHTPRENRMGLLCVRHTLELGELVHRSDDGQQQLANARLQLNVERPFVMPTRERERECTRM